MDFLASTGAVFEPDPRTHPELESTYLETDPSSNSSILLSIILSFYQCYHAIITTTAPVMTWCKPRLHYQTKPLSRAVENKQGAKGPP